MNTYNVVYDVFDEDTDKWERFEQGDMPTALFLNDYRKNRNREDWRISTQAEEVCEYVLWLESKLEECLND